MQVYKGVGGIGILLGSACLPASLTVYCFLQNLRLLLMSLSSQAPVQCWCAQVGCLTEPSSSVKWARGMKTVMVSDNRGENWQGGGTVLNAGPEWIQGLISLHTILPSNTEQGWWHSTEVSGLIPLLLLCLQFSLFKISLSKQCHKSVHHRQLSS